MIKNGMAKRVWNGSGWRSLCVFCVLLCAQHASADDSGAQTDLIEKITAKFDQDSTRATTRSSLNGCELRIARNYTKNCSSQNTEAQQKTRASKKLLQIDLATVGAVRISAVRGETHLGLWPARRSPLDKLLGKPSVVRQTHIIHHCNGDSYDQETHISADLIISKPVDPELQRLLEAYIKAYCD
ncbi:hypothetical protein ACEWPL_015265 [Roseovarius sp. S1116L3]|uniref:hypothetical protein n=1 Tax=Roseovarius roseus TaxID=3342636 RepID=UPI0037292498